MIYLDEFRFLDADDEWGYFSDLESEMSYDLLYPFTICSIHFRCYLKWNGPM